MDDTEENRIRVGSILNTANKYIYLISSVYFAINIKDNNEYNKNNLLSLFSYILNDGLDVSIYIDTKKFQELFKTDVHNFNEFIFPFYLIITIHIHDQDKTVSRGIIHTYYSINLIADRIIKKENTISLEVEKTGESEVLFSSSEDKFGFYKLILK